MAILTQIQLAKVRRKLSNGRTSTWNKPQVNAAIQAIEDRLQASKSILNSDIESAAPGIFTVAQKRIIFANAAVNFAVGEGAE